MLCSVSWVHAAAFDTTQVTPSQRNVAVGRSATISLTWSMTSSGPSTGGTVTISSLSTDLEFLDGSGTPLGSALARSFSRTGTLPPLGAPLITTFSEPLLVPRYIIDKARSNGANQITVRRRFTATGIVAGTTLISMTLNITGSAGGSFAITRLALDFGSGEVSRVVTAGTKFKAYAQLTSSGTGLLRGVWEIADPSTTRGEPIFRPLLNVRQYLTASQRITLSSPDLPSNANGLYQVRFRITEPTIALSSPLVRYVVGQGNALARSVTPVAINLMQPGHLFTLNNDVEHPTDLLPWYVNGTLTDQEYHTVDEHVSICDICKDEIKLLQTIQTHVKASAPSYTPGELGLRRVKKQIQQENKSRQGPSKWWQPAMAAAVLVIVLQTGLLLQQYDSGTTYGLLGKTEQTLQISFSPAATEAQIREVLTVINGRIVDGPGALGVYHIKLHVDDESRRAEQTEEAIITLKTYKDVIQEVVR